MNKLYILGLCLGLFGNINAQLIDINEDFETFTDANFPQNGWTSNMKYPFAYFNLEKNKYIVTYSFFNTNAEIYIISPELASINGKKTLKFKAGSLASSTEVGYIQVGVISNPSDTTTFTPVGEPIRFKELKKFLSFKMDIPETEAKHIAFKIILKQAHTSIVLDNIIYDDTLATQSVEIPSAQIVVIDNYLQLTNNQNINNIKIYSPAGQVVLEEKTNKQKINISALPSGVYFTIMEINGIIIKSKFVKP